MNKLRVGDPLDKSVDMGAIVDKSQLIRIKNLVSESEGQVYYAGPRAEPSKRPFLDSA